MKTKICDKCGRSYREETAYVHSTLFKNAVKAKVVHNYFGCDTG